MSRPLRTALRRTRLRLRSYLTRADVALFHHFEPPPTGGGHQFLRALVGEFQRRGLRVAENMIGLYTRACLVNSFNFDAERFAILHNDNVRVVHRVDGPVAAYRGTDDGTDHRVWQFNSRHADATILQSNYSRQAHEAMGLTYTNPVIITNTPNPEIFHPPEHVCEPSTNKLRVISTSWSDNPNKGADVYAWLDQHLDFDRIEYTFVGRIRIALRNIRRVDPLPSDALADRLRQHHVYLTASRNDPCSNALLEALACGLPALYHDSGGHGELVGNAGLAFESAHEIPALLDQLRSDYPLYQRSISLPTLAEVAACYLRVLGIEPKAKVAR